METTLLISLSLIIILSAGAVFFFLQKKLLEQREERRQEIQALQESLSASVSQKFENLAGKIFEDRTEKFSQQNAQALGNLFEPLKERIKDFEKRVNEIYSQEKFERGTLKGELNRLMELNQKMSQETVNLTKALKGENKVAGNWGELILENILERSGLKKGEEYIVQATDLSLRNADGSVIRPDVIVNLPDGKHLIVDSKVSLVAYEAYSSSTNPEQQDLAGKAHVESLKRHIDGLSSKKYQTSDKLLSPDFVILFLPIEPAFALAFKLKPDLLQYAWERNIALVSPTTLLTTLRTVAVIWRQERQERNALEIAKRGGALYDKFVGLVSDIEDLGKKIEATQKVQQQIQSKLSTGTGNLIRQVEMLRELGAKSEKKLPPQLTSADQ